MAKQNFSMYVPRDKPPKRPRRHSKSLNKSSAFKKHKGQGR